jgi:hypothetical protein
VCGDLNPHRDERVSLQFVELGSLDASPIDGVALKRFERLKGQGGAAVRAQKCNRCLTAEQGSLYAVL